MTEKSLHELELSMEMPVIDIVGSPVVDSVVISKTFGSGGSSEKSDIREIRDTIPTRDVVRALLAHLGLDAAIQRSVGIKQDKVIIGPKDGES